MRHERQAIENAGGQIVLVGMGSVAQAQAFKQRFEVPFQMICDPDQHLYREFAIERMSPLGFFSPSMVLRGIGAMAQGHTMGLPEGDVRQLPGVVIIDHEGIIQYRYESSGPADHPSPQGLVAALSDIRSTVSS